MRNLPQIVFERAHSQANQIAYRFFQGNVTRPDVLTFESLWEQAASVAFELQSHGLDGERVLLACTSQKFFVVGFFACLLAGCVAVPTPPPRRDVFAARLGLLAEDADVRGLIADSEEAQSAAIALGHKGLVHVDMRRVRHIDVQREQAKQWRMPVLDAESIAFLQYTSGSTSDPKGVIVTHGNLMRNCAAIQDGMAFTSASSILTALPLFHDMGLVGGVLESMYVGCIGNCMPPAEFVQYPERWLQIISAYNITISGGPNFMYELAARSIAADSVQGCDLSAWEVAFCGAEPIRAATIENFTNKFASLGFKARAFYPCYGMAESTLFITGKRIDDLPAVCSLHGSTVVNCGTPRQDTQVAIVDQDTMAQLTGTEVGEIWVRGDSVSPGYWRRPALTQHTFAGTATGLEGKRFLRTGDLGYMKDGDLFVTGRLKDLIIKYGKKYSPQDIEREAELAHVALRESGSAAFSVAQAGSDRLVLVAELKREWLRKSQDWELAVSAVRSAVSAAFSVAIDEIVLIKTGSLPRTSSGKVRRAQTCLDYLAGRLTVAVAPVPPVSALTADALEMPNQHPAAGQHLNL